MPILHESDKEWMYTVLCDGKFKYDPVEQLYKYDNTIKFPNKVYNEKYDPKSFMERGDVINFNGSYRNKKKMIFDGTKLESLWTDVDDYGSVPPTFVCGDGPDEFNIGDFEDLIDHNSINWLSKEKLKEIKIYKKNNEIYGKVTIKEKLWIINIEMQSMNHSEFQNGWWGNKKFNCVIENDTIKIYISNSYLIKSMNDDDKDKLNALISENGLVHIISYNVKSVPTSTYYDKIIWFAYHVKKETKLNEINNKPTEFPIIWTKKTIHYISEVVIDSEERYDFYMKNDINDLDKIYISEIIGYPITIELIKNDTDSISIHVKNHINKLIEDYDNINKRHPFNKEGSNSLTMYL